MKPKKIILRIVLFAFLFILLFICLFVLVGIPLMKGVPIESIMAPKVNIKGWRGVRWEEREITYDQAIEYINAKDSKSFRDRNKNSDKRDTTIDVTNEIYDKKDTTIDITNEIWDSIKVYGDKVSIGFGTGRGQITIIDSTYHVQNRNDFVSVFFSINDLHHGPAPDAIQSVGEMVEIPMDQVNGRPMEVIYIACHDYSGEWNDFYNYYIGSAKTLFDGYDQTAEAVVYDAYKSIPFDALGAVYFEAEGKYQYKLPIPRYRARKKDNIAILSTHVTGKLKDLAPRYMEINEIYDRALAFKIDTTDIEKPIYVDRILMYDDYNEIILREHVDYVWDAYRSQTYPEEIHNFRGSTYLYQVFLQEEHLNENEYRVVLER